MSRKIIVAACILLVATALKPVAVAWAQDNIYAELQVQPLTLADCARCHSAHYNWLKNNGAAHSGVACTDCHEKFHVYNPRKNNYADIMPKCSQCHDLPHGDAQPVTQCLSCHLNPHEPIVSLPKPSKLEPNCKICHAPIAKMLADKPSKHTQRYCSECHSKVHGRIPDCSECHESHSPLLKLQTADCLKCHPVHTPLEISYPESEAKELCAGCHQDEYNQLKASKTKHHDLTCAFCHPSHGEIPKCQRCHGDAPHNPSIHKKFPQCLTCHSNPHDLKI
ncbi:MAG: cytochrome C [Deltaproteobacteria bacterium]